MGYIKTICREFLTKRNLSYLLVNIGNIPVMATVSSFLAVYYVNVLGMDEYAVGTMFLAARIFDAVNDPLIGYLIDRAKGERLDKFKKILVIGVLICAVNYLVLWIGPAVAGEGLKMAAAYISYLLLGVTFPVMDISLNSLLPAMTEDAKERDTLSSIKIIGYGVGTVITEIGAPILLSAWGSDIRSYSILALGTAAGIVTLSCAGAAGIRKNGPAEHSNQSLNQNTVQISGKNVKQQPEHVESSYHVKDMFRILFVRNVWSTFLSGLCFYSGNAALAVSNTYYVVYYLDDIKYLAYVTAATYSLELFVIVLLPYARAKIKERYLFGFGLLLAGAGILFRVLPFGKGWMGLAALFLSSAVFGIGYGFAMILFYSIQAENVDEVYRRTQKQAEGAVASLMSMVNKFGKGIGGAVPLYVLGMMKRADGTYTDFSLKLIGGVIPAVLVALGGIVFLFFSEDFQRGDQKGYG